MEEKKYLNEEQYQKTVVKIKKIGKPLLIIGIILLVIGIILSIIGFTGYSSGIFKGASGIFDSIENSAYNDDPYNTFSSGTKSISSTASSLGVYFALFAIGGVVGFIGFGLTVAGAIMLIVAHQREVKEFAAQSTLPVTKEIVDDVTPTVSKAAGSIAKEVSKGIAEGKEEIKKGDE